MTEPRRCGATTKRGTPCASQVEIVDTPLGPRCVVHDPGRAELMRRRAQAGGAGRRRPLVVVAAADWPLPHGGPPQSAEECATLAGWAVQAVATGRLDVKVSREIAVMISAKLRAQKEGQFAERVRELEQIIQRLTSGAPPKE